MNVRGKILIVVLVVVAFLGVIPFILATNRPRSASVHAATPPSQPFPLPSRLETVSTLFWIDVLAIGKKTLVVGGSKAVPTISSGQTLTMYGWAVDKRAKELASAVYVQVDGNSPLSATYRLPRADVARFFREPSYADAGFRCNIRTENLSPGIHSLNLIVINSRKTAYYYMDTNVHFSIREHISTSSRLQNSPH